jgi:hypothetical protein
MHLLKHAKKEKPSPVVPIQSHWVVPYYRKMRGRRFREGRDVGPCGPPKPVVDVRDRANLERAVRNAAKLPPPEETEGFDIRRYRPMPGKVLVKRPAPVKVRDGVELPENMWFSEDWFFVVAVGTGVTVCAPGDRVIFGKKSKPRPVKLGGAFHLGRASAVAAIVGE